jgi:hypothetical protein
MQMVTRRNNGSLVGGSILIILGLLALLGQLFKGYDFWGHFWPFIVIGFGATFFVGMLLGGKSVAGLAIPGSIITVCGLMLLLQNLTGYWQSWSYSWTVMIISVGLGIFIMGVYNGNSGSRRAGLRVIEVGFILLIVFGAFFEMIFSIGRARGLGQIIFPSALILLGIYLVLVRSGLIRRDSPAVLDQPAQPSQEHKEP